MENLFEIARKIIAIFTKLSSESTGLSCFGWFKSVVFLENAYHVAYERLKPKKWLIIQAIVPTMCKECRKQIYHRVCLSSCRTTSFFGFKRHEQLLDIHQIYGEALSKEKQQALKVGQWNKMKKDWGRIKLNNAKLISRFYSDGEKVGSFCRDGDTPLIDLPFEVSLVDSLRLEMESLLKDVIVILGAAAEKFKFLFSTNIDMTLFIFAMQHEVSKIRQSIFSINVIYKSWNMDTIHLPDVHPIFETVVQRYHEHGHGVVSVSYTHLTLPTIYSV